MLQVCQSYKSGVVELRDVAAPVLRDGGILVRTVVSVISSGTEGMKVREARMSLLEKARARPDQVLKVLETAQQQGIRVAYQKAMNKLDSLTPLGYSLSGVVVAVGAGAEEFHVGQRVACAGAGFANHAEFNFIPKNLAVPVPPTVGFDAAAFATLGAIALHGLRQGDLRLGETACVVGLGLVGQLLVQLLRAAGVTVIGVDPAPERRALAERLGAWSAAAPDDGGATAAVMAATGGTGVDGVFLTAASDDNGPLELALELARDRGRVVAVGKTKLDLPYVPCFRKEVDLRFSRSYGPGRYDPSYEMKGVDYPIGYVRWTERRNMAAFLDLAAAGRVDTAALVGAEYAFAQATEAYETLRKGLLPGLSALFRHDETAAAPVFPPPPAPPPARRDGVRRDGVLRIGAVGAGNYACSMLFPALRNDSRVELAMVIAAGGLSAADAARKFGFAAHGTDSRSVLDDPTIDAVVIATRHAGHPALVAAALAAGKATLVEKPLAIDAAGLALVEEATAAAPGGARLLVGFNRRFSPAACAVKDCFTAGAGPLSMVYRVHAGSLDATAWQRDPEEGGRFIGEAGHFFDLFAFLTMTAPTAVTATRLRPAGAGMGDDGDNLSVIVDYADGSTGTLIYLTQGGGRTPKERLEVFGQGRTVVLDNFESVTVYDGDRRGKTRRVDGGKGQAAQMAAFVAACRAGGPMPISPDSLFATTRLTLAAVESAVNRRTCLLRQDACGPTDASRADVRPADREQSEAGRA